MRSSSHEQHVIMITFSHVTKQFPQQNSPALSDVSVTIAANEFAFLVGPSGAGKSTFLRMCIAEVLPDEGDVVVDDLHVPSLRQRQLPQLRQRVGIVFQDFRLLPDRTVSQNIAFAFLATGGSRKIAASRVPEALELVGLADKGQRLPHELSGGEQQRAAIARAIINEPDLLIADEPTGNLDPANTTEVMDLLTTIHEYGATVVMATHDVATVNRYHNRVIEMTDGKIVRDQQHGQYQQTISLPTAAIS